MQTIDLDENDYILEVPYTGTDNVKYTISTDVVEAHEFLVDLGTEYPNQFESRHEVDQELRQWAEAHGGKHMPASYLLLLQGAIRKGFEEFKKKADRGLISLIYMEPELSILDRVKDGSLKLAQPESSPSENSENEEPKSNLPPTGSTD